MAPQWPGAPHHSVRFEGGILWEQLEAVGVPGIVGTYVHNPFLVVVAIKQQYAGHAKQAGMAVLGSAASARNGRFVVIVDEDIDPSNMKEVIWAMTTRVDPKTDIEIVETAGRRRSIRVCRRSRPPTGPFTNSRAIFYAVRPWALEGQISAGQPHRQGAARGDPEEVWRHVRLSAGVGYVSLESMHTPFVPAQAGTQGRIAPTSSVALGPRLRGDERKRLDCADRRG